MLNLHAKGFRVKNQKADKYASVTVQKYTDNKSDKIAITPWRFITRYFTRWFVGLKSAARGYFSNYKTRVTSNLVIEYNSLDKTIK